MQTRDPHPDTIHLRPVTPGHLPAMLEVQTELERKMAGAKPRTRWTFFAAWDRIFVDPRR